MAKGKNLREILDWDCEEDELKRLLDEPFKIDVDDFPLIAVVTYNHRKRKYDINMGLKIPDKQKKHLDYAIYYDHSPEDRIIWESIYPDLIEGGVHEKILTDLRTAMEGNVLLGQGMYSVGMYVPSEISSLIWPEFANQVQLEQDCREAWQRLKESYKKGVFGSLINDRKHELERMKDEFLDNRESYKPKNLTSEEWEEITFRGAHHLGNAIGHFDRRLK